jgi:hypothetical protein
MDRRGPIRERRPLIGPGLLMLVDTLLHRSLFFSKNMYERRVSDEDRLTFAKLIRNVHTASTAGDEFRESWLNHTRFREGAGLWRGSRIWDTAWYCNRIQSTPLRYTSGSSHR